MPLAADAADGTEAPDAPDAEPRPVSADAVPAGEVPAGEVPAADVPAPPAPRLADDTLSMLAGITAEDLPAVSKIQMTTEGTLIMRPVPDQGPVPAGEVMLPPEGMPDEPGPGRKRADRR